MTPADIITALGALAAAIGSSFIAYLSYKSRKDAADAKAALVVIEGEIFALGSNVDGRLTQLLAAAKAQAVTDSALARAEGVAAGEQAQRDRE